MKKALITGITGQDGSYLAEFLIEKGWVDNARLSGFNAEVFEKLEKGVFDDARYK